MLQAHPGGSVVRTRIFSSVIALLALAALAGCSAGGQELDLVIGGIPDQDLALLQERFDGLARYLSERTGYEVRYVPSVDYAAVVTAFRNGDIQLAWFGGLTGVQARLLTPGAEAIAQRPEDAAFHSVFVADPALGITALADVAGHSLTFGSESSTSGHLMPRAFLLEAGVDPEDDLDGPPNYSGSHDATWKLVEAGAYQVGALNESVIRGGRAGAHRPAGAHRRLESRGARHRRGIRDERVHPHLQRELRPDPVRGRASWPHHPLAPLP
jgi:phosphonate transport system substrate-binding protein